MATITLQLPDTMYRKAQRIAQTQKIDLHDLLIRSIVLEQKVEPETAEAREEATFQALHPQLIQTHLGQYIAITGGKWVDSDPDQLSLYRRVKKQYPDQFVLLAPVTHSPIEEVIVRSPRLGR